MKNLLAVLFLFLFSHISFAQDWARKMQEPDANFYDIKADFDNYWLTHDKTDKGKGYKVFKRWEHFVAPRVYPTGDLSLLNLTAKNYEDYIKGIASSNNSNPNDPKVIGGGNNLISSATWTAIGPMGPISGMAGNQFLKAGRLNFITIDPSNSNNLWVGAPAGGLWSSTNGGVSWTTNTDALSVIGCSDLAIDPTNTSIMYLATGDGDAGDTRSIGVLKSTNGGVTWSATGLTSPVTSNFLIRRLIINPTNTSMLFAATSNGLYRTTNGGANWSVVAAGSYYDVEFQPGNSNTVYACGTAFRLSTNGGASFSLVNTGIPTSGINRMAIAVTPADVNYVYVLASNSSNSGFQGLYQSTNSGASFALMSNSPNILDGSTTGSGTGGQGWYDLCIAASPLNRDEIVIGGVNVWRSVNGGTNWAIYGHWTGSGGSPFTHADHHDMEFDASGTLYDINDGTVYRRTGSTWTEICGTMNISQIYKMGMSSLTANKWITGHQDNGTSIWNGTTYNAELGGDGMDCFFDRTNDQNVFGEYQNGAMMKSNNGGLNWSSATSGMTGNPPWVTIWKQDPQVSTTLYAGYTELFRSTNMGISWSQLTAMGGSGGIIEFAIAPSNNQVIYVLKTSGVYKTTNGGSSWSNVTGTIPAASANPSNLCIDPTDPNNVWVVLSGYSSGNKVFTTTNGGTSWTNISAGLPNIPANCCVYEPGSNDMVYIGMDVGIYFRSATNTSWNIYNAGLPNAPISDLEISPASPTLLHAATYGRGVWVASVFSAALPPVTSFSVTPATKCAGKEITFTDQSINIPSTWAWTVTPNTGVTINSAAAQNPTITFGSAGIYTVSLMSSNANGAGNVSAQTVVVANSPALNVANSSQTVCSGTPITFNATGATTYSWSNGGGSASSATYTPLAFSVYSVTGTSNGCSMVKTVTASISSASLVINATTPTVCAGYAVTLSATGATSFTWSTALQSPAVTVSPTITTTYTVEGMANGCKLSATKMISVSPLPDVFVTANDTVICIDEPVTLTASGTALSYTWDAVNQNTNSVVYNPNTTTSYVCSGTGSNGCVRLSVLTVTVSECVGLNTLAVDKDVFAVFPNPTKGKLVVKITKNPLFPVSLEVIDVAGKIVFSRQLVFDPSEKTAEVNISGLTAGSYFVKLNSQGKRSEAVKIIKE